MSTRAEELAALAKQELHTGRVCYDLWLPSTLILKGEKGYSFDEVYDWLHRNGEKHLPDKGSFRKNMAKRYNAARKGAQP